MLLVQEHCYEYAGLSEFQEIRLNFQNILGEIAGSTIPLTIVIVCAFDGEFSENLTSSQPWTIHGPRLDHSSLMKRSKQQL